MRWISSPIRRSEVSAHYLVDEDGTVYRLVPEEQRAWHAGLSYWRGERDVNSRSIGIEIQNPGERFGYRAFPDVQMVALEKLCSEGNPVPLADRGPQRDRPFRYRLRPEVGSGASVRLAAPGIRAGIGLWPDIGAGRGAAPEDVPAMLAEIGYDPVAEKRGGGLSAALPARPDRQCGGCGDGQPCRRSLAAHRASRLHNPRVRRLDGCGPRLGNHAA